MNTENRFKRIFSGLKSNKAVDYSEAYEDAFAALKDEVGLLFEIGVRNGGSIRGWKAYFPAALIVGIDVNKECYFKEYGTSIEIGNAANAAFIDSLLSKYGDPDIVIDDGSHLSSEVKASYNMLYPRTKLCYVIEDYGSQYDRNFINDGAPATPIVHRHVDDLLATRGSCRSVKVYHSICFFFKA